MPFEVEAVGGQGESHTKGGADMVRQAGTTKNASSDTKVCDHHEVIRSSDAEAYKSQAKTSEAEIVRIPQQLNQIRQVLLLSYQLDY